MRIAVLLTLLPLVACGPESGHDHRHEAHDDHNHAPKYGGVLVELGEHEFQVELLLYPKTGKLEAYLWDGHVEHAVPSTMASLTVRARVGGENVDIVMKPAANPYAQSTPGEATKFEGTSDALTELEEFDGTLLEVAMAGKKFKEIAFHYHPDAGHDHEHDHEH